jgi:hypothetical protein
VFAQDTATCTLEKTNSIDTKVPGQWTFLNTVHDNGQTYLRNADNVIIAVARNPLKPYSFSKVKKNNFHNVTVFYKWDTDYSEKNDFKTQKLKENAKRE